MDESGGRGRTDLGWLAELRAQRAQVDGRIAEAQAADRDAFVEALARLHIVVMVYVAEHQLLGELVEQSRKNVDSFRFADLWVELGHDEPGYARYVAVIDESTGCRVDFTAPPPPQALRGLIAGFLASRAR